MTRSAWKIPFVDGYLIKKAKTAAEDPKKPMIKTWSRRSTILPQFVGLTFMRRYKLLVPKDDILEAFADKVLPIVEQKRLLHQKNLNLVAQRDMLLPRLMSGKLEV